MKSIYYKVTYPDGVIEYWTSIEKQEVQRLEFINNGKLIIEKVKKSFNRTGDKNGKTFISK